MAERYAELRKAAPEIVLEKLETAFAISYAHNSTAIEGNTLTLLETKLLLDDKISVGGKGIREIHEIINHDNAFNFIKAKISEDVPLDEKTVKDIHFLLMDNIIVGGNYRDVGVMITGAIHKPPAPREMFEQIKEFFVELPRKAEELNAIELVTYTHAEFVKIHPFIDGNGRVSRLIMNYQLMRAGLLPVSIAKENRFSYYDTLDEYAVNNNLQPFVKLVFELEQTRPEEAIGVLGG